jgi:hypothetical protein
MQQNNCQNDLTRGLDGRAKPEHFFWWIQASYGLDDEMPLKKHTVLDPRAFVCFVSPCIIIIYLSGAAFRSR